jgi:hypothetical protein
VNTLHVSRAWLSFIPRYKAPRRLFEKNTTDMIVDVYAAVKVALVRFGSFRKLIEFDNKLVAAQHRKQQSTTLSLQRWKARRKRRRC